MSLLNDASLVFIPSGYKEDKVYSVIPSNGAGDLDFVRGCDATRVNPQSLVENTPWNLFNDTEDFTFGTWSKVSTTVTANTTIAPNGAQTADTAVISSGGYIYYQLNYSGTTGSSISMSVYSKTSTTNLLVFGGATIAGTDTEQILSVGNGWYRHIVTRVFTTTASGIVQFVLGFYTPGTHIIWGAQLNVGTIKPYFPTTDRLNVPRLTYSPTLIERQSTNLVKYSEQFNNSVWTANNTTLTVNDKISPEGTLTADKFVGTVNSTSPSVSDGSKVYYNSGVNSTIQALNNTVTCSVYVYAETAITIQLFLYEWGGAESGQSFTLTPNAWQRIEYTKVFSGGTGNVGMAIQCNANTIWAWGAQLETGTPATSYIPTTSTAVTRVASYNSGCPSLLLEKQSTNLALYSEDFSNIYWTKNRSTVTVNSATSPDGTITADLLTEDSSNGTHEFISIPTVSIQAYSFSIYAKANTRTKIQLVLAGTPFFSGGGNGEASFDLSLGTVISAINGATGLIENVGNGWYRCTINKSSTASGVGVLAVRLLDASANSSYTGNGTSSAYYWGAQLEASTYPTSYIPTTSATVTRLADSCSKTGISSLIGQTEGTLFVDCNAADLNTFKRIAISSGSYTSSVYLDFRNDGSVVASSWTSAGLTLYITITPSNPLNRNKYAIAYKSNDWAIYVNGVLAGSQSTGAASFSSTLNTFEFALGGNDKFNGKVNEVLLFKRRLTNTELANLTTL